MMQSETNVTKRPWHGDNTIDYSGTFDATTVRIAGWEYSANGWDGPHFAIQMPTHAVAWMRPKFAQIAGEDRA